VSEEIEQEIAAIKSVMEALTPLSQAVRQSVLDYVVKRLQLTPMGNGSGHGDRAGVAKDSALPGAPAKDTQAAGGSIHIKEFKLQKNPKSASEMSAVVAYYLANLLPQADRKDRITARDIDTYFKIAGFPLPKSDMTLVNAKAAGYFDSMGNGAYRLNAVGHNLVAHSLPRTDAKPIRRAPAKKPAKRR
jgi:hypothetical protein